MRPSPASVHIQHADLVVATGLYALLSARKDWTLTCDAAGWPQSTGADADVLVTDYPTGVALARGRDRRNGPAILVVSQLDREWDVRTALESGVHGYLLQSAGEDDIIAAVEHLVQRKSFMSEALSKVVAQSFMRDALTSRESDVLQLLAEGCCNKLIARRLGIGIGTVKSHVQNVLNKLDANARTHAVVVATQRGLVTPRQCAA